MASVLILGATSDVAMCLAENFAIDKFDVILASRNAERLYPLQSHLQIKYGIQCSVLEFDAEQFDQHENFVQALPQLPSETVCAFGYLGNEEIGRTNVTETLRILNANFTGAVTILNSIALRYKLKNEGCIIGISSVAGDRGRSSNYLYGSAKAGFTAYLSGLRNEMFHHKVRVVTVLPGFIASKMTAHLRLPKMLTATPQQVASIIYTKYRKKDVLYVKWFWRWIMLIIKMIPEFMFKKLKM